MPDKVMKDGTCPKCGSKNIYAGCSPGHRGRLVVALLSGARLEDYVCVDCGYLESYLDNPPANRDAIQRKWRRVTG